MTRSEDARSKRAGRLAAAAIAGLVISVGSVGADRGSSARWPSIRAVADVAPLEVRVARAGGPREPDPAQAQVDTPEQQEDPNDAKVVARVGESVITAGELRRALAQTPRSVLAQFGSTPDEIRKNYLDRVLVRDALFAEEARARGIESQSDVRDRELGAMRAMLVDDVRREAGAKKISDADVKSFFESNPDRFVTPKRIQIQRILVATEAEASALIADLGERPDPKRWNDAAREKSLDKANNLRGGALGLVAEDGSTGQAETKVDPAIFAAADAVKDGTIVPSPVREGPRWAVVLKRQTVGPVVRSLDAEAPSIRAELADQRLRTAMQALLDKLRPTLLTELNVELCDMVSVSSTGELDRSKRPGTLPRSKRNASPAPNEGAPGGLR